MADGDGGTSEPLRYEGLSNPRNIRLMELLPAATQSEAVRCTLEQACLDVEPQYEALSYTWGDPSNPSLLYCNNAALSITSNLDAALRHLRLQTGSRALWVDAICINQADVEERSQQVALMRDVYTKASQVIAWLGEEHLSDSGAMDFVDPNPLPQNSSKKEYASKAISMGAKLSSSLLSAETLIQRPWFSRAWIIQEAALARRLQVQCGNKTIDWESLHANLRLMNGLRDATSSERFTFNNNHYQRIEFVDFTRRNIEFDRRYARSPQTADERSIGSSAWSQFHSAVVNARSYGASDRRDHVYALLGLVNESNGVHLPVDYSRPYSAVFRDFIRCIIHRTGSLSALGQIDSSPSTDLESWVPDYGRPSYVDPLSSKDQPASGASGDSKIRLTPSDEVEVLSLSGILFDTIDEVAMGPSTDKNKVFPRSERMMHENADKIDPMEVVPKLAIRTIRRVFPQSKDVLDQVSRTMGFIEGTKDRPLDYLAPHDQDTLYKRRFDLFADGISLDPEEFMEKYKTEDTLGLFSSPFSQLRTASKARLFGPMHPVNDIYMKPALEEQWQRLARRCIPYPAQSNTETAYWRTLIGNKRTLFVGDSDEPPDFWHDAYKVWHELLWEKEGIIPRFLHGRGIRRKELPTSGTTSGKSKEDRPLTDELQSYFRNLKTDELKLAYDGQLRASATRAVMLNSIRMSQNPGVIRQHVIKPAASPEQEPPPSDPTPVVKAKGVRLNVRTRNKTNLAVTPHRKPDGFEPLSSKDIDQVADWIERYPNIRSEEKDQLMEILSCLADDKAQSKQPMDTLRAKISQTFRYDFLRVARNRKFCITKKRYMGWCPFETEPGDRICILFGGQTPYIVRKQGAGYRFLGEAYIHGVMNGEVLGMADIKIETIRLL
ncbi:MAG: hypothetical protein LQ337_002666 [Flavoplaca oasis]|nr:MAG: hypothetical protein LQ337_002666 [Flavoplaca oasis]